MPQWDNDLYYRFRAQRTQPAHDLVARIDLPAPADIVDLGCGGGNSTSVLRGRWPDASIVGVDSSEAMLTEARGTDGQTRWLKADIATWQPQRRFDLVFSNAALQWIPDHATLLPRLFTLVRPRGILAVQLPDHYESALYRVLLDVSHDPRWSSRMDEPRRSLTRNSLSFYYDVLRGSSEEIEIWKTEYHHELEDHQDILTFHRGSGMRPYLERLSEEEVPAFEQRVLEGYREAFPRQANGCVLFPFRRLFFLARA